MIKRFCSFFKKSNLTNTSSNKNLAAYIKSITGFNPIQIELYQEALTHSSHNVADQLKNYERLEFLGDSVLSSVVSLYVYNEYPNKREGYLSQMRSKIVNRKTLNKVAKNLKLDKHIISQKSDIQSENILGNAFEALVGALYLDRGYQDTEDFILKRVINNLLDLSFLEDVIESHKSYLYEWSQKKKYSIEFLTNDDPSAIQEKTFQCQLLINGKMIAKGRGPSKKKAEEKAAQRAYFKISKGKKNH